MNDYYVHLSLPLVGTSIIKMKSLLLVYSHIATLVAAGTANNAAKQLESFWIDSQTIVKNLDEYSVLWIKPHGCV
jgi:hypothetical protein